MMWRLADNRMTLRCRPRKHFLSGLIRRVIVMSSTKIASSSVAQSAGVDIVQRIIGIAPAPLLPTEAEADYLGLAARIVALAQPKDPIEEFLTRDVVDLTWEILRLRRLKGGLLRAAVSKGVHRILLTIRIWP